MLNFELYCSIVCGAIVSALLLALACIPMLGILQQGGYSGVSFLKWYYKKGNMFSRRISLLTLSSVLLVALIDLCFSFAGAELANLFSAFVYVGVFAVWFRSSRRALKVPFKRTGRAVRLLICFFVLLALVTFGAGTGLAFGAAQTGNELVILFRFAPLSLMPLLCPPLLAIAGLLMKTYETPRNRAYIKRAAQRLNDSPCVKAGITGSFGKTSVKTFAATILSEKYKVIATPASYNTPIGIARTVNEKGLDCDIFLAEMGARKKGDVTELCELVKPSFGVVTGVCAQHLQTFGSLEAIKREKGVLADYAQRVVLGRTAADLTQKPALRYGADFAAEEAAYSKDGVRFTLRIKEQRIPVETPLLGEHTAEDIALAAALCFLLGMSAEEIAEGVKKLSPVPHRLEKIEANGVTILDDSYNSNTEGAKCAVETLKLFGGNLYVVTPGLVELGEIQEKENEILGGLLVGLRVILVGETQVLPVKRGYLAAGGEEESLRIAPTLDAAREILAKELKTGDCVLFLNDLPDIYNR